MWPVQWRSRITKLEVGNERIAAIELSTNIKLCLISVYLPSNNPSVNSHLEYSECLDILHDIIMKYRPSHKIFIVGNYNGTLLQPRPYNKHDVLLNSFVREHELNFINSEKQAFFHHSGASSSQIDYILTTDRTILSDYKIAEKCSTNSSSHTPVSACIQVNIPGLEIQKESSQTQTVKRLHWNKIGIEEYQNGLSNVVSNSRLNERSTVNERLDFINATLHKAARKSEPEKVIKLKGPSWKASPVVRNLLKSCKTAHKSWLKSGENDNNLKKDNISAKRALRKQLLKEKFNDRKHFYYELMSNSTSDKFHRFIRRNKGNKGSPASSIIFNGKEIASPDTQRKVFAQYYEDLSISKEEDYDSAFLELCRVRHKLIEQLCKESESDFEPITENEVLKATSQLKSNRSADESGLTAEHLKNSGDTLTNEIKDISTQSYKKSLFPVSLNLGF